MQVGFIGLGNMGSGMAKNLLAKGFSVIGFDADNDKLTELETIGLNRAADVVNVANSCQIVILCLPNPDISRAVILEQLLVESNNASIIIETSTLTPDIVKEFENKIVANGKQFLSAPMIGGKTHAADGTIEFLVEGQSKIFQDCKKVLQAMGKTKFMGDIPSATFAKLTFNLSRYANLAVGVETHRLLKKYGANIPAIYDFMSEQSLDNFGQVWKEDLKEMMSINVPYKPSQVPKKDLKLLAEMAKSNELNSELVEAIRKTYLSME